MAVDGGVAAGVVAGRYQLLDVVGSGGMGRVWLARDEVLARDVAVKEMLPVVGLPPGRVDVWEQTIREARTAARLNHPNVVRVYDVLFTDGRPWIVMELVAGRSLDALVREDGPLDPVAAGRVGLAVLAGLDAAHRAGVLHRDVKPHNVLLADDGRILLGDFGVAVFDKGDFATDVTREDVLLASPEYVAPERVVDSASTVATDLWSFGATLYWAVEGRPPYRRDSAVEQLGALVGEDPDPVVRAGALAPVLAGLLRHRPGERLTAGQAKAMLEDAVAGVVRVGAGRRKLVVAVVAAGLVAAGGLTAYAADRPEPQPTPPAAAPVQKARPGCGTGPFLQADNPAPEPEPVTAGSGPTALPAGWVWHNDERFRVGLPQGWSRTTGEGVVCLLDPTGRRSVTVDPAPSLDPDRVASWQREEERWQAGGQRVGYRRVEISPVIYRQGAADWEYTYQAGGVDWHVLRRNFAAGTDRGFVVSWTATQAEWEVEQPTFRTLLQSFDAL